MTRLDVLGVTRLRAALYLEHTHYVIHMDSVLTGLTGEWGNNLKLGHCFEGTKYSLN